MPNSLEEYLKQFRSGLKGVPQKKRDGEVEEMRQHLQSLVQQHVENGDSQEASISTAIRQFGSARTVARAACKTWRREHRSTRRETTLRRAHLWLTVILVHSLIVQLLTYVFWRLDNYFVPSSRYHYPSWLPFRPDEVAFFIGQLPTTIHDWVVSPFYSWMAALFLLVFALCSLRMPRETRTTFFGVFTALLGSSILIQMSMWRPYLSLYDTSDTFVVLERLSSDLWRVALFLISSWALLTSLARDKSLVSQLKRTRTT